MNILVVGCGKVGQNLVERLVAEGEHNITVLDINPVVIRDITNQYDIMGVVGSGTALDILLEAGVEETDILIAVTESDEINLLTCLIAKKVGGCQTIARVRKPEYGKELSLFKEDLGLAMIINPELTAANEIARTLRFPSAIQIDTFAKGRIEILKFRVTEDSPLHELQIKNLSAKLNCDVLVCGVERGEDVFIPGGEFVLQSGDLVSIVASLENATYFFKRIGIKTNKVKDTIIVGGGNTAYYLASQLLKIGIEVKIFEQDEARCNELCELLPKATIIHGDGTDCRLLQEEGIEQAASFVALTNIDEENVLLSLYAKSKTSGKVVTKINRISYDEVISKLYLDTTVYPKNTAAEYVVRFVRAKKNSHGSNIETLHYILDGKAEALEFRIRDDSPIADIPIEQLQLKKNILIACINRNGRIMIPRGRDVITKGDTVIVVTTHTGFQDISDILE